MSIQNVLKEAIVEKALTNKYKQKVNILGYSLEPVVPIGDNYASDLYRATVTFCKDHIDEKECTTLIVKISHQGGLMEDLTKSVKLFPNEIEMFSKTLPAIYKLMHEKATLSPDLYYSRVEEPPLMVLEDLKHSNFVMHERQTGFDLQHCMMIMERLAKYHAATVVLDHNEPNYLQKFNIGLFSENDYIMEWIRMAYESFINSASTWPGCETYAKKLKKLDAKLLTRSLDASRYKANGFNVLIHGDLWINNIMLKYTNNGKLCDLRFIDFQLIKYTSPVVDLHYFLATSPTDKVRENYVRPLLERYYSCLLFHLTEMQHPLAKIPTFNEFLREFEDRAFYGLLTSVTIAPLVKASHRKDASFENLLAQDGKDSFRYHCYNNDRYRALMEGLLPYYDSLGIMD